MTHTPGNQSLLPIIMIDDDADDLEMHVLELVDMGIKNEIFCFQLPYEALDFLRILPRPPYFITCDVHMARIDAYDLRTIMLSELSHLNDIPFYILTALLSDREIAVASNLHIYGFFTKGFTCEAVRRNFQKMTDAIENGRTIDIPGMTPG